MNDLGAALAAGLTNGPGGRVTIGASPVFGQMNAPRLVVSAFTQKAVDNINFSAVQISGSGTPAAKVGRGLPKPVGASVAIVPKTLDKYAATSSVVLEDVLAAESSLLGDIADVLLAQASIALDADAVKALDDAVAEVITPAASWLEGLLNAQAAVAAAGGAPSVVVISAADWGKVGAEIAAAGGFAAAPGDALVEIAGSAVIVSGAAPAGEAFVFDPRSTLCAVREAGAIVDPYSQSTTNTVNVTVDLVAGAYVTNPAHVAAFAGA